MRDSDCAVDDKMRDSDCAADDKMRDSDCAVIEKYDAKIDIFKVIVKKTLVFCILYV